MAAALHTSASNKERARRRKFIWDRDWFFKKRSVISRRKQRSAFDQEFEFDRGRMVAYREIVNYLSGKLVVVLDETKQLQCGCVTVGWRRVRRTDVVDRIPLSAPHHTSIARSTLTQNHGRLRRQWCDERKMWVAEWNEFSFTDESRICLQQHYGRTRVWRHHGERMLNSCVMHHHTDPAPGIVVWGSSGYHSRTPLGLATTIFQQDNARPHVARIVQRFFVIHQIELLPWSARSPDLSPIENMWSVVDKRFTQIRLPAATPDQLWLRMEAFWSAVLQEHIQSLFESMPRRVAAVISNNGGCSGY
ncbi:transposable element Tcb1 transposase [Trichonephila clavipes]|nr:transposable element Tcb1 transposase [Trichonephila clavipes]